MQIRLEVLRKVANRQTEKQRRKHNLLGGVISCRNIILFVAASGDFVLQVLNGALSLQSLAAPNELPFPNPELLPPSQTRCRCDITKPKYRAVCLYRPIFAGTHCGYSGETIRLYSPSVADVQQELSSCWDGRPFGHNKHGPKSIRAAAAPLSVEGAGSPSNTMSPGLRPTSVPSGILIRPTVWLQYPNVTHRQDRQTGQDNVLGPIKLKTAKIS